MTTQPVKGTHPDKGDPMHATRIHPHTGHALTPVGYRKARPGEVGPQPIYSILGASEDDGAGDDGAGGQDAGAGQDLGFPADTRPDDMEPDQRAAYFQHQAKKHENRNKDWRAALGGKLPDEVKAELDELEKLRAQGRTEQENAVEDAKKTALAEAAAQYGSRLVAAEFKAALAHLVTTDQQGQADTKRRDDIIAGLNLTSYLTSSGDVDTDKVTSYAATIAPAGKGTGDQQDIGGGRQSGTHGGGARKGSISAIVAERREQRAKRQQN